MERIYNMKSYIKQNKGICVFVILLQIILWGSQTLVQLLNIRAFDNALNKNFKGFLFWFSICFLGWISYFIIGIIESYFREKTIKNLNNDLRNDYVINMFSTDYQSFHSLDTAEHISYLTSNVEKIRDFAWDPFFDAFGRISQIIWSIVALAYINKLLLLIGIISAIIMWYAPKIFEKKMQMLGNKNVEVLSKTMSDFKEIVFGFDVIKLFSKTKLFINKIKNTSESRENSNFNLNFESNKIQAYMGMISVSLQIMSELLIVYLAFKGEIKLAVIIGGTNLIGAISNGLNNLATIKVKLSTSKSYFKYEKSENKHAENNLNEEIEKISIENLTYKYDDNYVFKDLNLTFLKNKKYAIIGKSGSGKSTLLNIIMGRLRNYSGSVFFNDKEISELSYEEIQTKIAYISQDIYLFNESIKDNILLGDEYNAEKFYTAVSESSLNLQEFCNGENQIVGENGKLISGGQKQRIAIARALYHGKNILLMDEGTSSLDKENSAIIENSLLNNESITLILVTHHLSKENSNKFHEICEI